MSNIFKQKISDVLSDHKHLVLNPDRKFMIEDSVVRKDALVMSCGALATWSSSESTGRSPKDTYIVLDGETEGLVDWTSPNNIPLEKETFNMVLEDALQNLIKSDKIYEVDRVIGADSKYALPVKTVTNKALSSLFVDNMFREVTNNIQGSIFFKRGFTLLALPDNRLDRSKYQDKLRKLPDGKTSNICIVIDFANRIGIVYGSSYMGSIKKMMFTAMNYYLPIEGILPLHCSANEGKDGSCALLLGLSGTGKTTLSTDKERSLLGDDEHGWSEDGVANFENGCYAKMLDIKEEDEPEIWKAVMHNDDYLNHGVIVENAMVYPNGKVDYSDTRYSQNSRSSYPLNYLNNIKKESTAGHPNTILFLTADAYGVLPPISRLNSEQAMLWFLMGYTSKLAGTEAGVIEPQATFSRFFGQPFMPAKPNIYAEMLGVKMKKHKTKVYLINTGWSGGKYGVGCRIKLKYTRAMVKAAINNQLNSTEFVEDKLFHLSIPLSVPNVPDSILDPRDTWEQKEQYDLTAKMLAHKFSEHFDMAYSNQDIDPLIVSSCPGK